MTRIGVMGGSFDPIHLGHLTAARAAAAQCDLDRVLFVPTGQAWHKDAIVAPADLRCAMVQAAIADDPAFSLSRVDVDRPGPTYTVDTLADLRAQLGDAELFVILGADALAGFAGWRDPPGILRQARLLAVTRPGHPLDDPGLPPGAVTLVEMPEVPISSREVRARVARGDAITGLVPDAVARIISEHDLYRTP